VDNAACDAPLTPARSNPPRPRFLWGIVAAAIALLTWNTLNSERFLHIQSTSDAGRIAQLNAQLRAFSTCDAHRYPVAGGNVVRCGDELLVFLREAPSLAAGQTFQLWTLAYGAKSVVPNATFTRGADGSAFIVVSTAPGNLAAVAISIEPVGGSKQPTTKPLFVRRLS
jgi:hypothetical protein